MMQRVTFVCFMTVGLLVVCSVAGCEKKPAAKTLAEDAQLFAGKGWTSEEAFSQVSAPEGDAKCKLTVSFEPDKGKPSGKVRLGRLTEAKNDNSEGPFSFKLIEHPGIGGEPGRRTIMLVFPGGGGPDGKDEHQYLDYSLDGDTLKIRPSLPWAYVQGDWIHFKRDK